MKAALELIEWIGERDPVLFAALQNGDPSITDVFDSTVVQPFVEGHAVLLLVCPDGLVSLNVLPKD